MCAGSPSVTEEDIENAIGDYLKNVKPFMGGLIVVPPEAVPEESMMFNEYGQEKYLLIKKFDLLTLPLRILRRLPVHLVKQFPVQVEVDSLWFWALTHDMVKPSPARKGLNDWELLHSFRTLMAAQLANLVFQPSEDPAVEALVEKLNQVKDAILPEPVKDLIENKRYILMYLCYPVLEGLTKYAMSGLVDSNGKIMKGFNDGKKLRRTGERISNLAELLRSLELNASATLSKLDFSRDLADFRLEVEKLVANKPKKDGWDSIYAMRNVSLHGAKGWQLRSGLITNLICLIVWHLIDDKETIDALKIKSDEVQHHFRLWNDYYPPSLL